MTNIIPYGYNPLNPESDYKFIFRWVALGFSEDVYKWIDDNWDYTKTEFCDQVYHFYRKLRPEYSFPIHKNVDETRKNVDETQEFVNTLFYDSNNLEVGHLDTDEALDTDEGFNSTESSLEEFLPPFDINYTPIPSPLIDIKSHKSIKTKLTNSAFFDLQFNTVDNEDNGNKADNEDNADRNKN